MAKASKIVAKKAPTRGTNGGTAGDEAEGPALEPEAPLDPDGHAHARDEE